MNYDIVIILALLLLFTLIREFMHYKQVTRLEELLKAHDISELYQAKHMHEDESPFKNKIMESPNEIAYDDPRFSLAGANKVIIDGQEKNMEIYP